MPHLVALDPRTGTILRDATPAEVAAYEAQPGHPRITDPFLRRSFFVATRVGDVTIDVAPSYESHPGQGAWDWL